MFTSGQNGCISRVRCNETVNQKGIFNRMIPIWKAERLSGRDVMKRESHQDFKSLFGLLLVCGWIVVILYSSYRAELGLTETGHHFIRFTQEILQHVGFSRSWDQAWMENALHRIIHIEAYILLGVFTGAVARWWRCYGRRRLIMIVFLGLAIALTDEGYQWLVLNGSWNSLALIWEVGAVVIGLKIEDFVVYSNR